ncbi:MAG: hypothetical protein PHN56_04725 [Candidatus Nanoarchaeia archaeon]|nr:hypothetical protein [Candidatus Nanoarchaeia archaeon]
MIDFIYSLNKILNKESEIYISYFKKKEGLLVKVFDFKKKGISFAKVYLNNVLVGYTNNKGELLLSKKMPKKAVLKAEIGIYFVKKEIIPQ